MRIARTCGSFCFSSERPSGFPMRNFPRNSSLASDARESGKADANGLLLIVCRAAYERLHNYDGFLLRFSHISDQQKMRKKIKK